MKRRVVKELYKVYSEKSCFSNYAFSLYLFVKRLVEKCIEDDIQELYFLSREGQFLKILFEIYLKECASQYEWKNIKIDYLYVSRKSLMNATLSSLDNERFSGLYHYKEMSSYDFLKALNFNQEEIADILPEAYKQNPKIENFFISDEFKQIKNNSTFMVLYEKKRITQYNNLLKYLKKIGFGVSGKAAVVDVGWNGTMQTYLEKLNLCGNLQGYYIGTFHIANTCFGRSKKGLLFENQKQNVYACYPHRFEYICTANHGATISYDDLGSPSLINDNDGELYKLYYSEIRENIIFKFKKLCHLQDLSEWDRTLNNHFIHMHAKQLLFLTKEEKDIIKKSISMHPDNLVDLKPRKNLKHQVADLLIKLKLLGWIVS